MITKALVYVSVAAILLPACFGQTRPSADFVVTNANIYTVDKQHPKAEAMAVIGDRIVAVGTGAEIDLWRGADTRTMDAAGKLLLPGFNDAHVHFVDG